MKTDNSIDRLIRIARSEPFNIKYLNSKDDEIYSQAMARITGRSRYHFYEASKATDYFGIAIQFILFIVPLVILLFLPEDNTPVSTLWVWIIRILAGMMFLSVIIYTGVIPSMWKNRAQSLIEKSMVTDEDIEAYMNTIKCVENARDLLQNKKVKLTQSEKRNIEGYLYSKGYLP